ncbi:MAG: nicotinate (nicotinamide) nucleotide adenylyltransferase [Phycisphaerales bacterium]|nr:nicotinate (nicotinamide) nucleotide adenylyltransferase [Phycisphaerales bacterium]MCI0629950.1 nicotinate (nicotinamide) nucleotide adenylyltransferase [Phycisphaerales bacterium]MCI0675367.1 nicotinate (nicotinamide) nucleotide adenylyltransferase [Phycisphaerales bacterium]
MSGEAESHPQRILLFGGTFDPPHLAHATLPALAARQLRCDQIVYIPAAENPLKGSAKSAAAEHRLTMLVLAIADVPNAKISSIELDRKGKSYTIDTLKELHNKQGAAAAPARHSGSARQSKRTATLEPPASFFLLIGCDQALDFHRWKDWEQIVKLATPAVMVRPPWDRKSFERELRKRYLEAEAQRWLGWTLNLPLMDINATEIRKRLREGASVDGMLDPAVAEYIRSNGLYR